MPAERPGGNELLPNVPSVAPIFEPIENPATGVHAVLQAHRNHEDERDALERVADDIDCGIAALPTGSPWRAWLAKVSRTLRAAVSLSTIRLVR
jgi:hypothetical protein